MAKSLNVPWVVVGPEPLLATCTICSRTLQKPPLPADLSVVTGYMRGFLRAHRGCYRASKLGAIP